MLNGCECLVTDDARNLSLGYQTDYRDTFNIKEQTLSQWKWFLVAAQTKCEH